MAKPPGLLNRGPLPELSCEPLTPAVPAKVETTPAVVILRIVLLAASET